MNEESLEQGIGALRSGDFRAATDIFSLFTGQFPAKANYWFLLGAARHGAAELDAARSAFEQAVVLEPGHREAHGALAAVCLALGDREAALQSSREAVALAPQDPQAHCNLAIVLEALKQWQQALAGYDRALLFDPSFAAALANRGALLATMGRFDEAIANNRSFVSLHPGRFEAHFNLGDACLAAGYYEESAAAFANALRIAPDHVRALLHGGFALAMNERFDAAQRYLDRAAALDPAEVARYREIIFGRGKVFKTRLDARTLFLLRHYEHLEQCDWRVRLHYLRRFTAIVEASGKPLTDKALAFRAMVLGLPCPIQLDLARQIAQGVAAGVREPARHPTGSRSSARLRIGYISPDFRFHALGLLVASLFRSHDRNRFEVFGYALGGDDGSAIRRQIMAGFDRFADLDALDDAAAAAVIAADRIDILVDLVGYLNQARPGILARRPAPLQISWIGYIATMGAPWMDYLIADAIAFPPECDQDFSEALVRLDRGLLLCSYANDPIKAAPSRQAAGLPPDGLVLSAMHNPYKIDPEIFALWMRLLAALPGSVLWLLGINDAACRNLRMFATDAGVDPDRLVFAPLVPHPDHLARLQLADLALDTPQCNGVTTTADALAAGIPVLTCPGDTPIQRMAASQLHSAGLDELIVSDLAGYERLALDILKNPGKLRQLKGKLECARASAPFYRLQDWVREYEEGLRQIWGRHTAGLPPAALRIRVETANNPILKKRVTAIY